MSFDQTQLQYIRDRLLDAFHTQASVPCLMEAVSRCANVSRYRYEWASTQKRVVSATQTRVRKRKELEISRVTGDAMRKQAVRDLADSTQQMWLLMAYSNNRVKAGEAILNMWLLNQFLARHANQQERTIQKLKLVIPFVSGEVLREVLGAAKVCTQLEIARQTQINYKNWKNKWAPRYHALRSILLELDQNALLACEGRYRELVKKVA